MPNQISKKRQRVTFDVPVAIWNKIKTYSKSDGLTPSCIVREAVIRAMKDISVYKNVPPFAPSKQSHFRKSIAICDKKDVEILDRYCKCTRTNRAMLIRAYLEEICREIDNYGYPYFHSAEI